MMDYLAQRDHSEDELRAKLGKKDFTDSEIDQAIEYGKKNGWIPNTPESNEALSQKTAELLSNKGKGIHYINHYLEKRGLPLIEAKTEEELEKARLLVKNKFPIAEKMDHNEKAKASRFLVSRGFDIEIVRKVIYESTDQV